MTRLRILRLIIRVDPKYSYKCFYKKVRELIHTGKDKEQGEI